MPSYDFSREEVLVAIEGSYGIVSQVARRLDNCDWHTAKKYIEKWESTKRAFEDENERSLDYTESQMIKAIHEGDGPMIRFHLATKGKNRGFSERHEVVGKDDGPVRVIFEESENWRGGNTVQDTKVTPGTEDGL